MKRKWLGVFLICLALIGSGCLGKFYQYQKNPTVAVRQGTIKIPELKDKVEVYFDEYGVPQIFADNEHDLFFAIGYIQAQDRLFEMVLLRAMSQGRMAELFGDLNLGGLKPVQYDIHQRVWGIKYLAEVMDASAKKYFPDVMQSQGQAYIDGVNTYLRTHQDSLPLEFQVLKIKPEEFRGADLFSFSLYMSEIMAANYSLELIRYAVMKEYGWDTAWKLIPYQTQIGPTIVPPELLKNKLAQPETDILKGTPRPEDLDLSPKVALALANLETKIRSVNGFITSQASNNWVVSGKMTVDGNPILCNDPHLPHMQPSIGYLMRVKGAGFDSFGFTLPGIPYIIFGHTRKLAWAVTNTEADVQDVYVEKVNPENSNQYQYRGQWKDFVEREETLKIRIGFSNQYREKKIKVRQSIHGPIINSLLGNFPKNTPPLALRWVGWDFSRDLRGFNAVVASKGVDEVMEKLERLNQEKPIQMTDVTAAYNLLMKGQSVADFKNAMDYIIAPSQNFMAADAAGHIAYLAGGFVPVRAKGRGMVPVPGWNGEYEWTGFIPTSELPSITDPDRGWIVSANNTVVDLEWYPYTFASNFMSNGWRAARIEELIQKMKPLDIEKMKIIQNDIYSKEGETLAPLIVKAIEKKGIDDPRLKQAAEYLRKWDYQTGSDSIGASIYYATMNQLLSTVLQGYFEPEFYQAYLSSPGLIYMLQRWMAAGDETFFQARRGESKARDMNDAMVYALDQAVEWLTKKFGKDLTQWQWGKLHTVTFAHPLGIGPMKALTYGPLPQPGADNTVKAGYTVGRGKNPFIDVHGPSFRHIVDLGKVDESLMVIDGSESGQYLDPHYSDLHKLWYQGKYVQAVMDEDQVKKNAKSVLVLEP